MNIIEMKPLEKIGYNFIDPAYIPPGKDEYYLRKTQQDPNKTYRELTEQEVTILVQNGNAADSWKMIQVTDKFNPQLVKNNSFHGKIRLGDLENVYLSFHDIRQPVGIYNSMIISCDIGSNVSLRNVKLLSHYIIRDKVILQNVDEMATTSYAKFGTGILKEGEKEDIRIWIETANENGGRKIVPFNSMRSGDAWLWSRYRGRKDLMNVFKEMTQNEEDNRRGFYGTIGTRTIIKHCRIMKDVHVGSDAYIKGANKLKNLTINSNPDSPTQIGEGVELVNGIVGFGCRIFYGVKAVRFIMDDYANLKYGARLINSYLGSNSTISCCEVLNSLIFPGHEQHHNSSFLCAATIQGQSNLASGATIGSNHNSRGNDGEIIAGRGFWPGLNTSLKHNSLFSSFNLLVKGSYPYEICNPLPFSLISTSENTLNIFPAYWFGYNMYALARNSWKYKERDKRIVKHQHLEFHYLAPDTINEMFKALTLLVQWVKKSAQTTEKDAVLMLEKGEITELYADHLENGRRRVKILKPSQAYCLYKDFILYYGVLNIVDFLSASKNNPEKYIEILKNSESDRSEWINVGGQLIPREDLDELLMDIESGEIQSWKEIHDFYALQSKKYTERKLMHASKSLMEISGCKNIMDIIKNWDKLSEKAVRTQEYISENTKSTREKDYTNFFRNMTYSNLEERDAVLGKLEDNSFIQYMEKETEMLKRDIKSIRLK